MSDRPGCVSPEVARSWARAIAVGCLLAVAAAVLLELLAAVVQ